MSERNPIRVFVTHVFSSHPDYDRVFEYLESSPNFFYANCSAPDHPPGAAGKEALKEEFRTQIKAAEVVLVLGSLYADNKPWITYQMDAAQAIERPLIALGSFGGAEKLPDYIAKRAAEIVEWNARNIVDAVRRQARHEETTRWDTIEFKMP
jgi:hypothetical protein